MMQQQQLAESPSKTPGEKLDVIVEEEDAEEQPEAGEAPDEEVAA